MSETIKICLAGFGTVGFGVYATLKENRDLISARAGSPIEVKAVLCRDIKKARAKVDDATLVITNDAKALINDSEINIVVEVMGGIKAARALIEAALIAGKDVVTANKYLMATEGNALIALAQKCHRKLFFEASVAGGIPIIKAIREGLVANPVESIAGIVNGTSNYILTAMKKEGQGFDEALLEAQRLGYAEADPTFDVKGFDAAHKITILSALAFGTAFQFNSAYVEGIDTINAEDVRQARKLGYVIKLIAYAQRKENNVTFGVAPHLVPESNPLARIDGVLNAVRVVSKGLGETFYTGRGAGQRPTASAVIADIVDVVRGNATPAYGTFEKSSVSYTDKGEYEASFYIRVKEEREKEILQVFDELGIKKGKETRNGRDVIFITAPAKLSWIERIKGMLLPEAVVAVLNA